MAPMTRAPPREDNAQQRRLQKDRERLPREQRRAQRSLQALEHARVDLDLPSTLVEEVPWRRQAHVKLLGKIFGLRFPVLCGCRTTYERSRVRGWDKHLAGKILGALPKQTWVRPLPHRGPDLLATLWRHVEDTSPATRSRWPWTWVGDESLFQKYGPRRGRVGTGWSGQEHRVRLGIDGLLRVVVIGEGTLVIPVDFTVRRPDPVGPGAPCRDTRTWVHGMLERTWAALQRLRLRRPAPLVGAASGVGDSKVLAPVGFHPHGTWLVEGKSTDVFPRLDGRRVTGRELLRRVDWPWRDSP